MLADRGEISALAPLLDHPIPGVRRAAARGLVWAGHTAPIESIADREPSEVVRAAAHLPRRAHAIGTWDGPRSLPSPLDHATEIARESGPGRRYEPLPYELPDGAAGRELLLRHAAACPADLADRLPALERASGRRFGHAVLEAIGVCGDPRALPRLLRAIDDPGVDPGRGFRERRLAAIAIARLGDPANRGVIEQALAREIRDHEGRPGAGLGIQEPVRCALIWALGELGDPAAARVLVPFLGAVDGHSTHLWAMGALTKLGFAVLPAVAAALRSAGPTADAAAANAAGVLGHFGPSEFVDRALTDPRAAVRDAAAVSLDVPPVHDPVEIALIAFRERRWHDAHDALEPTWRVAEGARRQALQGVIQGAAALEHLRRNHPREARGQWSKARHKLRPLGRHALGLDLGAWCDALDQLDWDAPPDESTWPIPARFAGAVPTAGR